MYQSNYIGLRKRESYDEIVALLDGGDKTKIKYPNRVASQILNSPYMKKIDEESLLDMQNQHDIAQKEQLKKVMIQSMSQQTGMPHVILKAKTEPSKTEFFDLSKDDERVEEFRSAIGSDLSDRARQQADRRHQFSQGVVEMLDKETERTPIGRHAMETQAGYDLLEKSTEITPYRFPSEAEAIGIEYGKQNEQLKNDIAKIRKQEKEAFRQLRNTVSSDAYRMVKAKRGDETKVAWSGLTQVLQGIKHGISETFGGQSSSSKQVSHVHPYKASGSHYETDHKSEQGSVKTESSKIKVKSETPKSSVKSEYKSSKAYSQSGMAQPVVPLSRSASAVSHGTVKSEPSSSSSKRGRGMAQPVGIVSGNASVRSESRSSKTRRSGMALPVGITSGRDSSVSSQYTVRSGRTASSQGIPHRAISIHSSGSSRK
jgi:hypothetical protein